MEKSISQKNFPTNKLKNKSNEAEMRLLKEVLKMFIYKEAVGFVGNIGVWSDGMGGYVLVDLCTGNRLYIH